MARKPIFGQDKASGRYDAPGCAHIARGKLPLYLGFCRFVQNARRPGKALLGGLVG